MEAHGIILSGSSYFDSLPSEARQVGKPLGGPTASQSRLAPASVAAVVVVLRGALEVVGGLGLAARAGIRRRREGGGIEDERSDECLEHCSLLLVGPPVDAGVHGAVMAHAASTEREVAH